MKKSTVSSQTPCLYIIHGWSYDLAPWQSFLRELKHQKIKHVLFKVPGLTQPSSKALTMDAYCQWLDKKLAKAHEPILLGHSNGGRIALHYSLKHPRKIKHLILLNSAGAPQPLSLQKRNRRLRKLSKALRSLKKIKFLRPLLYKLLRVQDYHRAQPHMKETMRNMLASDLDLQTRISDVKTPVNLIWGENDQLTPLSMGRYFQNNLSHLQDFEILAEARHSPYATHPQVLAQRVAKILKKL